MSTEVRVVAFKRWQLVTLVVTIIVVALSLPVGVMAATGSSVNIRDYSNNLASGNARVTNGRLVTEQCDSATATISGTTCARVVNGRELVSDGAGPLTIDGSVNVAHPTPFAWHLFDGDIAGLNWTTADISPAGKHWVIQGTAVKIALPTSQSIVEVTVNVTTAGTPVEYWLPMTYLGTDNVNNQNIYVGQIGFELVADPATSVGVTLRRSASTGNVVIQAGMTGYLY